MSTRSSRRNAPVQFHQLSYEYGKDKRSKKKQKQGKANLSNSAIQNKQEQIQFPKVESQSENFEKQCETIIKIQDNLQQPQIIERLQILTNQKTNLNQPKPTLSSQLSINSRHQFIVQVINKLIAHNLFPYLDEAKLRPTTSSQIRQMKQKLRGQYKIEQFTEDLYKIFRIFFQQADFQERIMDGVKQMQYQIIQYLQLQSYRFDQSINQSRQARIQSRNEARRARRNQNKRRFSANKTFKSKSRVFSSESEDTSFEAETTPIQDKKPKKSTTVAPRSKFATISHLQIASLGLNISKLPSEDLAIICFKFFDHSQSGEGGTTYYKIQLQKLSKFVLFELEAHVKTICKQRNWKYEEVKDDEDGNFMIESDESEEK